jgi:putative tricarboxylic transport membrane protein
MNETSGERGTRPAPDRAGLCIAAGLLLLAGLAWWDALQLGGGPSYSQIGPAVAAKITGAGLAILGILTGIAAWRGGFAPTEPYDHAAVWLITAGFAALIAIIWVGGGFIFGMTVIFAATTYAFGRRAPQIDIPVGFALALLVYLVFTKLLTLSLPAGPLERLL